MGQPIGESGPSCGLVFWIREIKAAREGFDGRKSPGFHFADGLVDIATAEKVNYFWTLRSGEFFGVGPGGRDTIGNFFGRKRSELIAGMLFQRDGGDG